MRVSQLVFVPDAPGEFKPAATEMCHERSFDIDQCGEKKKTDQDKELVPEGVKQGVTLSPNVTEIVSL